MISSHIATEGIHMKPPVKNDSMESTEIENSKSRCDLASGRTPSAAIKVIHDHSPTTECRSGCTSLSRPMTDSSCTSFQRSPDEPSKSQSEFLVPDIEREQQGRNLSSPITTDHMFDGASSVELRSELRSSAQPIHERQSVDHLIQTKSLSTSKDVDTSPVGRNDSPEGAASNNAGNTGIASHQDAQAQSTNVEVVDIMFDVVERRRMPLRLLMGSVSEVDALVSEPDLLHPKRFRIIILTDDMQWVWECNGWTTLPLVGTRPVLTEMPRLPWNRAHPAYWEVSETEFSSGKPLPISSEWLISAPYALYEDRFDNDILHYCESLACRPQALHNPFLSGRVSEAIHSMARKWRKSDDEMVTTLRDAFRSSVTASKLCDPKMQRYAEAWFAAYLRRLGAQIWSREDGFYADV